MPSPEHPTLGCMSPIAISYFRPLGGGSRNVVGGHRGFVGEVRGRRGRRGSLGSSVVFGGLSKSRREIVGLSEAVGAFGFFGGGRRGSMRAMMWNHEIFRDSDSASTVREIILPLDS